jgi:hypothetical protein
LHPLLKKYHEKYPDNNALKKWVIDITTGGEVLTKYGVMNCTDSSFKILPFKWPLKGTKMKQLQSDAEGRSQNINSHPVYQI